MGKSGLTMASADFCPAGHPGVHSYPGAVPYGLIAVKKKIKLSLFVKVLIAIVAGALLGLVLPDIVVRIQHLPALSYSRGVILRLGFSKRIPALYRPEDSAGF